jgi:pimeloyl-ACP methyl ester carboxylesterase
MTTVHTEKVDGLDVFFRKAGDPAAPKLLLLGGFPSSSHQFRNLMPALADRFHLLSIDYPGFGNTEMPDPATWDYTFDHLAEIVDHLLHQIDFTGPMGMYMQDYGGPIGNRLITEHPEWLTWQVIQNANTWNMDSFFLTRPNAHRVQLDLFYDYRKNAELYPTWQKRLRDDQPLTLIFWGQGDIFFTPEGGEAYLRDLPDAELVRLDAGHFAIEDSLEEIVGGIKTFYDEKVAS